MRRKIFFLFGLSLISVVTYFSYQYYVLTKTNQVPYNNLTEISSASCYVYFNIEYRNAVYPVVLPNSLANSFISMKSTVLRAVYPLYLNEVIKRDRSITVDSSLFAKIQFAIVSDSTLMRLRKVDLIRDSGYVDNRRLSNGLTQPERNVVIYRLLKGGYNCCIQDESGHVIIDDLNPSN
jgi:hypothetical protein